MSIWQRVRAIEQTLAHFFGHGGVISSGEYVRAHGPTSPFEEVQAQVRMIEAFVKAHGENIAEMEGLVFGDHEMSSSPLTDQIAAMRMSLDNHRKAIQSIENDLTEFMLHQGLKFDYTEPIPAVPEVPSKRVIVSTNEHTNEHKTKPYPKKG